MYILPFKLKNAEDCGTYAKVYLDKLTLSVEQATTAAIQAGEITTLDFSAYPVNRHRADAKDSLSAFFGALSAKTTYSAANKEFIGAILNEYVKADGLLDEASTLDAIDLTSARATLRANWYDYYLTDTLASIKGFVGESPALLEWASSKYSEVDKGNQVRLFGCRL